jgi:hypothetical protein
VASSFPFEPIAVIKAVLPIAAVPLICNSIVAVDGVTPTTVAVKPTTLVEIVLMVVGSPPLK